MASFFIFLCFLSFSVSVSASTHRSLLSGGAGASNASQPSAQLQQACRATWHRHACLSTLSSRVGPGSTMLDVIQAAFLVSAENLNTSRGMVQDILDASAHDWNRSRAAQTCLEGLSMSEHRTTAAIAAVTAQKLRNARAWTSAALSYQYGCWSGLKYVNNSAAVNSTMSFIDTGLLVSTSNALSMLRAVDTGSWTPPQTERDGFWEPVIGSGTNIPGFNFAGLTANVTVAKQCADGCYKTVQEAVEAAPMYLKGGERFVIKIDEGVYEETVRVYFNKSNLVFLGDGMGKTVITGSLNAGILGVTTYETATVGVLGDGFMASGITFQNTAEPPVHQAVAFRSSSDYTFIENCEFLGFQDTLYAHSLRQFYKSCHIEGHIDFIFGNGAAIFQDCTILVRPRQVDPEHGETNTIAAHGRTDPAETTGLVFIGCLLNGTNEYMKLYRSKPSVHQNYLARPWKMYTRTVYINCTMEDLIHPDGWMMWDKDFALSTLYYGEFGNSGPGADLSKRVSWSSKIPEEHVPAYYFANFLQGDEWVTLAS